MQINLDFEKASAALEMARGWFQANPWRLGIFYLMATQTVAVRWARGLVRECYDEIRNGNPKT